jgi:hypothetical protein
MNRLSGVELLAAMRARRCAAGITNNRCARARRELMPARTADLNRGNNRERGDLGKFWMVSPKCVFSHAVTRLAERDQVLKPVRFAVITEQAERSNVMNRKVWLGKPTMLASVMIAPVGKRALSVPVCPAMIGTSAAPARAIGTDPIFRRTPFAEAFTRAEIELMDRARCLHDVLATGRTLNGHTLPACAYSVRSLPFTVAGETAEMPFRFGGHIRLSIVGLPALGTRQFDHSSIIR